MSLLSLHSHGSPTLWFPFRQSRGSTISPLLTRQARKSGCSDLEWTPQRVNMLSSNIAITVHLSSSDLGTHVSSESGGRAEGHQNISKYLQLERKVSSCTRVFLTFHPSSKSRFQVTNYLAIVLYFILMGHKHNGPACPYMCVVEHHSQDIPGVVICGRVTIGTAYTFPTFTALEYDCWPAAGPSEGVEVTHVPSREPSFSPIRPRHIFHRAPSSFLILYKSTSLVQLPLTLDTTTAPSPS